MRNLIFSLAGTVRVLFIKNIFSLLHNQCPVIIRQNTFKFLNFRSRKKIISSHNNGQNNSAKSYVFEKKNRRFSVETALIMNTYQTFYHLKSKLKRRNQVLRIHLILMLMWICGSNSRKRGSELKSPKKFLFFCERYIIILEYVFVVIYQLIIHVY